MKLSKDDNLLKQFNGRDSDAFGEVYLLFYRELNAYASIVYRNTEIMSEDVIHDIFINMWISKTTFTSLNDIKGYIYISIKNGFRDFLSHTKCVDKYNNTLVTNESLFLDIFECEVYSSIDESLKILPKEYAEVLRMFIDGYKPSEIAEKLGRTQQNIYNIKYEAISVLKNKFKNDNKLLFSLLVLFH